MREAKEIKANEIPGQKAKPSRRAGKVRAAGTPEYTAKAGKQNNGDGMPS
ncbi:MAG: hypothetical protein LBO03_08675 [Acidaminococcales bacterium]|jgi:hypothetical protein|nr:hypothetical protein [Acidaminococcales bacterium]